MVEPEQEKNMSEMYQFLHLPLNFLASSAPLTIFQMTIKLERFVTVVFDL